MSVKKVAVLGATGNQGGAVAAALSKKGVEVVALTRNVESDKAKALAQAPNTTVRRADLDNVDSLIAAFEGCDGAFVVANFWEGMDADKETQQYKNAADALREIPNMKHIVYSTLEETDIPGVTDELKSLHTHRATRRRSSVPHFDSKARSEIYFAGLPVTFMHTSCYFENFTSFFTCTGSEDGSYTFVLPLSEDKQIPWTCLPDLGVLVASTLAKPELIGQRIGQASFMATGHEIAEILSKVTTKTVKYQCVPWEVFAGFGFPGAEELAQMFQMWLITHDKFCADRDLTKQADITGSRPVDPVDYGKTFADKMLFSEFHVKE